MGNSRARAVYEANLSDDFVRPQNDQALETFIRAKYEKKKYIAKEYVPQKPPEYPDGWQQLIEAEKQKKDVRKIVLPSHKPDNKVKLEEEKKPVVAQTQKVEVKSPPTAAPKSSSSGEADLLGLAIGGGSSDILGLGECYLPLN